MIPVWQPGTKYRNGYGLDKFEDTFVQICETHRKEGSALLFAFVLTDIRAPGLDKVLADDHYWKALDEEAGNYLSIFCFRVAQPEDDIDDTDRKRFRGHASVVVGQEIRDSLPCFLLFQVQNGRVSRHIAVALKEEKVEDSFLEIRNIVRTVVRALSDVSRTSHDLDTVFELAQGSLRSQSEILLLSRLLTLVPYFEKVFGLIKKVE